MKVYELIKELQKFNPKSECYAYEGEVTGVIVENKDGSQGVIYADESGLNKPTVLNEPF